MPACASRILILCALLIAASVAPGATKPAGLWHAVHVLIDGSHLPLLKRAITERFRRLGVNVLIVEVDYNFEYRSHPELRAGKPISKAEARELATLCRSQGIRLIPQFQSLGHQSWAQNTGPLLTKSPELDETPKIPLNNPGIYCRSWCPLNPKTNEIVFALIDELIDAFQADAVHCGMDEVYLIASDQCPLCRGKDPAELYAKQVNDLHKHLAAKGCEMLMWGDMLLNPSEASYAEAFGDRTGRAVDLIPKDIIVCDWHYGLQDDYPSVAFFQRKGFRVLPSGWYDVRANYALIECGRREAGKLMLGHMFTTWMNCNDACRALLGEDTPPANAAAWAESVRTGLPLIRPAPRTRISMRSGSARSDIRTKFTVQVWPEGNYPKPIRSVKARLVVEKPDGTLVATVARLVPGKPADASVKLAPGSYRAAIRGTVSFKGGGEEPFLVYGRRFTVKEPIRHLALGAKVTLKFPFSPKYPASGPNALTDGVRGSEDWRLGDWQGFEGKDLDAIMDLGTPKPVHRFSVYFLVDRKSWIFPPEEVFFHISDDGKKWLWISQIVSVGSGRKEPCVVRLYAQFTGKPFRFIRIRAKSIGVCPPGHEGAGKPAWLFVDEVVVR